MVNLEEARFWQESAREWWHLYENAINTSRGYEAKYRRIMESDSRYKSRIFMGITDQDQLYA